jgi:hypothetical protein
LSETKNVEKRPTSNWLINERSTPSSIICMNCLVSYLAIVPIFEMIWAIVILTSVSEIPIHLFSSSGWISILSSFCSQSTSAFLSDSYLILSHKFEQFVMNFRMKISLFM